jgi:lipopolysaccharide/colanic/teichoic acid biosynthesis glycosyltransferase
MSALLRPIGKRALDISGATAGLVLLGPVLLACGAAIALRMGRPVLFRQVRLGRGGAPFSVVKFRTMVPNAEKQGSGLYLDKDDPRVPPLGRLLRKTSLDELPQLWNVLRGEMSLVGPRPMVPEICQQYAEQYRVIHEVKPGLTGLAQVEGREDLPRSRRLALDAQYARGWSLRGDLAIIGRTVGVVLSTAGQRDSMTPEELER